MMGKLKNTNILHIIVISYMLLALVWWSYLLYTKNNENYILQSQLFPQEQENLKAKYQRQKSMIIGESIFFGLALITGIWLINRSYKKEVLSNQKQNNFLLSITHELKSPLASIKLILQTLLKRNLELNQQKELSRNALKETNRLEAMVGNILLATKIDHSYDVNFEEQNVVDLIADRIDIFQKKFPNRKIIFNNSHHQIYGQIDQEAFYSIITNLIENANKYSDDTKTITIELRSFDNYYEIELIDEGIGIEDKNKIRVFDKFFRIGNEDVRKTKGSGLGLYIVKQMVEAHEGSIKILDNRPQGSRFKLQIPKIPK